MTDTQKIPSSSLGREKRTSWLSDQPLMVRVQTHKEHSSSFPPIQTSQLKMDIHWFVLRDDTTLCILTFHRWYWVLWCRPWGWCALVQQDCFCLSVLIYPVSLWIIFIGCRSPVLQIIERICTCVYRWRWEHRTVYNSVMVLWHSFKMRLTSPLMIKQSPFQSVR